MTKKERKEKIVVDLMSSCLAGQGLLVERGELRRKMLDAACKCADEIIDRMDEEFRGA